MKGLFSKLVLGVFLLGVFGLNYGQKVDAKSKQILDAVSANYKSKQNTYFKFIYGSGSGKVTKAETGIFYSTPTQYKLKIMGTEQIYDGNKIYNISDEDQEITIAKSDKSEAAFSPMSYLDSYKEDYNATYVGKKSVQGISADLIKLVPIKNNGLKQVYIYVNSAKNQLIKIEQYGSDKDIATITIKEYKENQKLAPNMFSFDKGKYKNYIVTEL